MLVLLGKSFSVTFSVFPRWLRLGPSYKVTERDLPDQDSGSNSIITPSEGVMMELDPGLEKVLISP